MKKNTILAKVRTYIMELTIVTAGVLIALLISNHKENNQAKDYYNTSIQTMYNEAESNYSSLQGVIENHTNLVDTISKYDEDNISINNLFQKVNGVRFATLSNTGLEFYTRNNINLIDFEIMSTLYHIRSLSELIEIKLERLSDFVYLNLNADSKESKTIVILYLSDVLNSEHQLLQIYKGLIERNIKTE